MPEGGGLRRDPEDLDGKDPEIRASAEGEAGLTISARGSFGGFFVKNPVACLPVIKLYGRLLPSSSDLDSYRVVGATLFDASLFNS
jgi:hypothetical protein